MSNRGLSFLAGLTGGYRLGSQMVGDYEDAEMRKGLGDAGTANSVTETVTGDEAKKATANLEALRSDESNKARDAAIAKGEDGDAAGLAAAQQYDPAIKELQSRGDKAEFTVMNRGNAGRTFDNAAAATGAADAANSRGMGDVYKQFGRPEAANRLQQQAQSLEAGALSLKGVKREDQVGEAAQGLKLATVENQLGTMKQEFKNKVAAGVLKGADLQRELVGVFADAVVKNPAYANTLLKDPDFLSALSIKDAEFAPEGKDSIIFTMADGSRQKAHIADLQEWRSGKQPLKFVEIAPGGKLVSVNPKTGKAEEVAQGNEKPEKGEQKRLLVKDAVDQIALAFGARLDPMSKMLDTSTIDDPTGYAKAIADAEKRVRSGSDPMGVASDIALKARRDKEARKVVGAPAAGGSSFKLW